MIRKVGDYAVRHRRTSSDFSATTVESDGDRTPLDDHGNSALPLGVLKHLLHPRGVFGHVDVLEGNLPFAVILPGGYGVGSGVLAEDQYFVRHPRTLLSRLLKKSHLPGTHPLDGCPSSGWVPGAPPCNWTFLSSRGKKEFFSTRLVLDFISSCRVGVSQPYTKRPWQRAICIGGSLIWVYEIKDLVEKVSVVTSEPIAIRPRSPSACPPRT